MLTVNQLLSLITAHAQSSAGLKLLVPQGSVTDIEQLERDWANPNATIEEGQNINLAIDPSKLHYFDPDTGLAIT